MKRSFLMSALVLALAATMIPACNGGNSSLRLGENPAKNRNASRIKKKHAGLHGDVNCILRSKL